MATKSTTTQPQTYATLFPHLVGVRGWLVFFLIGIILSAAMNIYVAIQDLSDSSLSDPNVIAYYPNLPALINFESFFQLLFGAAGIYLFIQIIRRQKIARLVALIYFITLIVYTLLDYVVAYSMFSDNQAALDAIMQQNNVVARSIFYVAIWLPYFLISRRVRATLTRSGAVETNGFSALAVSNTDRTTISKTVAHKFSKELSSLESIAIKLDKGCRDGTIDTDFVKKSQSYLNSVSSDIIDSKAIGNNAYIVYEVQSLIHWINGEETESRDLAKSASLVKGDKILFTQTANNILRS